MMVLSFMINRDDSRVHCALLATNREKESFPRSKTDASPETTIIKQVQLVNRFCELSNLLCCQISAFHYKIVGPSFFILTFDVSVFLLLMIPLFGLKTFKNSQNCPRWQFIVQGLKPGNSE